MKSLTRPVLWLLWLAMVFGLFNCYGPPVWSYQPKDRTEQMTKPEILDGMTLFQLLGVIVRNDSDTRRYSAYANAILGHPYNPYYVRPMKDWTHIEGVKTQYRQNDIAKPEHPLLPWRDFSVEYPPGMLIFTILPALFTSDVDLYYTLFNLEMELLLTLSVFAAVRATDRLAPGQGQRLLLYAVGATAACGFFAVRRYDACVSAAIGLTFWSIAARRSSWGGAALALGVIIKGAPILFAPLGALDYITARRWPELLRAAAAASAVCLLTGAAYLLLAGEHWSDAFAYHRTRPLEIESTYAALLIFLRAFIPDLVSGSVNTFGSSNIVSPAEPYLRPIASIAPIIAFLAIYIWAWRALRATRDDYQRLIVLAKTVCAIVVAYCALGKVFSPQYVVWLIPAAPLASLGATATARKMMFAALVLSQIEFPFAYTFLSGELHPEFGLLVLARNGALIAWIVMLLKSQTETVGAKTLAEVLEPSAQTT